MNVLQSMLDSRIFHDTFCAGAEISEEARVINYSCNNNIDFYYEKYYPTVISRYQRYKINQILATLRNMTI